jgi:hypothetical protein
VPVSDVPHGGQQAAGEKTSGLAQLRRLMPVDI